LHILAFKKMQELTKFKQKGVLENMQRTYSVQAQRSFRKHAKDLFVSQLMLNLGKRLDLVQQES
jgi:hypothetical protein